MSSTRKGKGQETSRTGLAEFFGVSATTVDHWVRVGCPYVQRGAQGKPWRFNTADVAAWREEKIREDSAGGEASDEAELKRRKLAAQTLKEELELAKARALVVPLEEVERSMSNAFAEVKANVRNVPSRVCSALLGETDEARFKDTLLREIDQALESLAECDCDVGSDGE